MLQHLKHFLQFCLKQIFSSDFSEEKKNIYYICQTKRRIQDIFFFIFLQEPDYTPVCLDVYSIYLLKNLVKEKKIEAFCDLILSALYASANFAIVR